MPEEVHMHSREAANEFRDLYPDAVTGKYDRRYATVEVPDEVPDRARQEALARQEAPDGPGQVPLTDAERGRIDFSRGRANVPWARSIKGLAAENGVDDWLAYVDHTLTVDEHREVMEKAGREEGSDTLRGTSGPDPGAIEAALQGECDHARGACKRGSPGACEFLETECGLDPETVDHLMPAVATDGGVEQVPYDDLDGSVKGAYARAWKGYQVGVRRLAGLLEEIQEELELTEQAATAIDAIEEGVEDVDTDVFEALRAHHASLEALTEAHAGDEYHRLTDVELAAAEPTRPDVVDDVPEETENGPNTDE